MLWKEVEEMWIELIRHYLFLNKTLAIQMKDHHSRSVLKSYIPYWFIFQHDIQNLFKFFLPNVFSLSG